MAERWYPGKWCRESIFCPECCGGENNKHPYSEGSEEFSSGRIFSCTKCRLVKTEKRDKERRGEYWIRNNCTENDYCYNCFYACCCPGVLFGYVLAICCMNRDCCNMETLNEVEQSVEQSIIVSPPSYQELVKSDKTT
jgi:hypothetical protein